MWCNIWKVVYILDIFIKNNQSPVKQLKHDTYETEIGAVNRIFMMSGPTRKLLGLTRARLQGYIKNARVIFMTPINEKDLEKEETELEDLVHRIDMNTAFLERCDEEWKVLL